MPVRLTVERLDRMVMGVASADMPASEFERFVREIDDANLMHYRKIVQIADLRARLTAEELMALVTLLHLDREPKRCGALAFVVDPQRADQAGLIAAVDSRDPPVKVFGSIHDARKWVRAQPPALE